ncbi:radical SAM family heme chaperone HemW [Helcococcus kunzii]
MKKKFGLYIHIPFCQKRCHYCDFLTFIGHDEMIKKYVKYLQKEIEMYKSEDAILDTIYIGGGTPSYLDEDLMVEILQSLYSTFSIDAQCEITIEMNPESVKEEKIKTYLENGINRFSMGVQSFDNEVLQITGRLHNNVTVFKKLKLMRQLGCKNISIDLMMANPKQDYNVLLNDLTIATKLDIDHISYYSLILKEHTYFELWLNQGQIELFNPEEERKMYHTVVNTLKEHGFIQYEISSFAKAEKFMSKHNQKYWRLNDYFGVGMGAASNLGLIRNINTRDFDEYFEMIENGEKPIKETEKLDIETREKEYLMLNLRMLNGFEIQDINKKFNIDFLKKYKDILNRNIENGILKLENNRVSFTEYGIDNGNMFFRKLYGLEEYI